MKKCINCGAELEMDSLFCTNCGVKQPTLKRCAKCGAYIAEDSNFCTECGARQIEEEQVIAPITEEKPVEVDNAPTQKEQDSVQEVLVVAEEEQKTIEEENVVVEEEKVPVENEEVPIEKEEKPVEEASSIKKSDNSGKGIMAAIITITAIAMAGIIGYAVYLMKQGERKYKDWEGEFCCLVGEGGFGSRTYKFEIIPEKEKITGTMILDEYSAGGTDYSKFVLSGKINGNTLIIQQTEGIKTSWYRFEPTPTEETIAKENLRSFQITKRNGKYYCNLEDSYGEVAERKLEHLFIPPFADIFAFYLKDIWNEAEVKKDYMTYMESRGEELIFDRTYEVDEGDLGFTKYSKLIYGANISFDEEKNHTKYTSIPFFGIEFSTWPSDVTFYFNDENDYKQYLKQIYAYGFKDNENGSCSFHDYDNGTSMAAMIHGRNEDPYFYYIKIIPGDY